MYEHFRNELLCALHGKLDDDMLKDVVQELDRVASRYEVKQRELSLMIYNDDLPELAKTFLVCKKIEGLSDQTLSAYMRLLKTFFREIPKPVEMIGTNDIRVFLFKYQQERGCSNRSLDKYRGNLASFFTWATDEGYLQRNPMRTIPPIKFEKKPRQNLTQLELEYLRAGCQTLRERAIIDFMYSTGCRVSEIAGAKKSDVDWNARSVHLFGKGKKHRTSYINAKAEVSLKAYLEAREDDCEYLFCSVRKPYRGLKREAIEKIVRGISGRSADKTQKHVTPHILRHTTATMALQSGMPIEDISKLLGHEKIDTTMIYAHTSMETVQAGHRKHIV